MRASDIISFVALVVSFIAAAVSYKLGRRTFRVTTNCGATERTLQMDQLFIEHPILRPYFSDGVPVPPADAPDYLRNRVLATAEYVVDILENLWDNEDCYAGEDRLAWRDWICEVFAASPACCEHYAENLGWYPTLGKLFKHDGPPPDELRQVMAALLPPARTDASP